MGAVTAGNHAPDKLNSCVVCLSRHVLISPYTRDKYVPNMCMVTGKWLACERLQ